MRKKPRAEQGVHAVRGVGEERAAQAPQDALEDRHAEEREDEDLQGADGLMREHLVYCHLEKERRQQAQTLERNRGEQDLEDDAAVWQSGLEHPAQAVGLVALPQAPAGEQQRPAGPQFSECRSAHDPGFSLAATLQEHAVGGAACKDSPATVVTFDQCR